MKYVVARWRYSRGPAWSRAGVMHRDGHRCAYCSGAATTIDHNETWNTFPVFIDDIAETGHRSTG